jgi:hypothetical protein
MTDDPRKQRLDAAAAELALVEISIWKAAHVAAILLAHFDDADCQAVAAEIQSLEDRRAIARIDVGELAIEMGIVVSG